MRAKRRFLRSCKRWLRAHWAFLDPSNKALGSWIRTRTRRKTGEWALGCKPCAWQTRRSALPCPHHVKAFASCTVTKASAIQVSHLSRHAGSDYHKSSVRDYLAGATNSYATAPPINQFKEVLEHVSKGGAVSAGRSGVGEYHKVRNMTLCLAEACKHQDRDFLRNAGSISLMRDARKNCLAIRFVAVDAGLNVRAGLLGIIPACGSRSEALAEATNKAIILMATDLADMPQAKKDADLETYIKERVHMLTTDAASDEVLASELMRKPLLLSMRPITPNLQVVLRDKAHASRRTGPE